MSDLSVSERRIRPIQDAVASGNWKQALKECDKWSKKGEKSDKFLALKAFVLISQPDTAQRNRGQTEVLDLCKRSPPVTDHEAIYQLQDALGALSLKHTEGPKLWERAVTAKQNDKDLYMRWLNQAIADGSWLSAQKAAMGLRKSFPKERQYEFWAVQMCYLVSLDRTVPEKDRNLFGTLAYRMISKAAETIPTDQEQLLAPGKAISSPEEVSLLVQILKATGRPSEAVTLFQGESLGLTSRLSQQDPQLVVYLLLECLEASEQWENAFRTCESLLSNPDHSEDARVWSLWLKAQEHLSQEDLRQLGQTTLDAACKARPINRAAYMAKFKLLASAPGDDAKQEKLLEACEEYASAFSDKAFCFDDLKAALDQLEKARCDKFLEKYSHSTAEGFSQLFTLKFVYSSLPPDCSTKELVDFAVRALELYQKSRTDSRPCPEAALLAALAILRLPPTLGKQHVLLATIMLEIVRSQNEDYYTFTVALVQLYKLLGVISLSMETFNKLSVKNMQYETVGHLLLTRISTLHPGTVGDSDGKLDPVGLIDTGLTMLANADMALVRGIREGLRFNSYSNIHNSVEMRSHIERSMNRQAFAIEERKLGRLRGIPDDSVLPVRPESLVDQRDFSYFPSFRGDEDVALLARFRKSLPKEAWIDAMALFDHVSTYLKAELLTQPATAADALGRLKNLWAGLAEADISASSELTAAEAASLNCHRVLATAVIGLDDPSWPVDVDETAARLRSWLEERLQASREPSLDLTIGDNGFPTCNYLHTSLTVLETLQTLAMYFALALKKGKGGKGKASSPSKVIIVELQTLVSQVEKSIHEAASKVKEGINSPGVLGRLVDLGMAREGVEGVDLAELEGMMEKITDEVSVEMVCGRLRESWEDAVDGVLAVRVKVWK